MKFANRFLAFLKKFFFLVFWDNTVVLVSAVPKEYVVLEHIFLVNDWVAFQVSPTIADISDECVAVINVVLFGTGETSQF
jgi:hypothetical protein